MLFLSAPPAREVGHSADGPLAPVTVPTSSYRTISYLACCPNWCCQLPCPLNPSLSVKADPALSVSSRSQTHQSLLALTLIIYEREERSPIVHVFAGVAGHSEYYGSCTLQRFAAVNARKGGVKTITLDGFLMALS